MLVTIQKVCLCPFALVFGFSERVESGKPMIARNPALVDNVRIRHSLLKVL